MAYIEATYWEIIDSTGVIHSGTSEEMDTAWDIMVCSNLEEYLEMMAELDIELIEPENIPSLEANFKKWHCKFTGDLKLIEIHKIYK